MPYDYKALTEARSVLLRRSKRRVTSRDRQQICRASRDGEGSRNFLLLPNIADIAIADIAIANIADIAIADIAMSAMLGCNRKLRFYPRAPKCADDYLDMATGETKTAIGDCPARGNGMEVSCTACLLQNRRSHMGAVCLDCSKRSILQQM